MTLDIQNYKMKSESVMLFFFLKKTSMLIE